MNGATWIVLGVLAVAVILAVVALWKGRGGGCSGCGGDCANCKRK